MSISDRIKLLRENKGLTQKALAIAANIAERSLQSIEAGIAKPSFDSLIKLSDFFGVSIDYLAGKTDEDKSIASSNAPKVFISYSWSSSEYEDRVTRIAQFLMARGVNVIYDKWDLKPGHDMNSFMEQARDDEVKYVLVLCDKVYKDKADQRNCGVGAETLIISPEVYRNTKQEKYIPIVMERDEFNRPYLPVYMDSRFYIDMSEDEGTGVEQLLRHIFGKPRLQKPPVGKPPEFIMQDETPFEIPQNDSVVRTLESASPNYRVSTERFMEASLNSLEQYRIAAKDDDDQFYNKVIESIDQMRAVRDSILTVLITMIRFYGNDVENLQLIHNFFEKFSSYTTRPEHVTSDMPWDYDNYRFILYELYLYTLATFLKYERFDKLSIILSGYLNEDDFSKPLMDIWKLIDANTNSLVTWSSKQEERWQSPNGYFLKARATRRDVLWRELMQADAFLYIYARADFFPWTYPYMTGKPFPLFVRGTSESYAMRFLPALRISNTNHYKTTLREMEGKDRNRFGFRDARVNFNYMCNVDNFGQLP